MRYDINLRGYNIEIPDLGVSISLRTPTGEIFILNRVDNSYKNKEDVTTDLKVHANEAIRAMRTGKSYYLLD